MNPIDIYKKLPQQNCGQCSAGTCMAFAVQYLRRQASLSQCDKLDEGGIKAIESMMDPKPETYDWKERRIKEILEEIEGLDFSDIAEKIGAVHDSDSINLVYIGQKITLSPSGIKGDIGTLDKLLVALYIKQAGHAPLTGKWVSFRDLKDGEGKAPEFHQESELPIAKMFEADEEQFMDKLNAVKAERAEGFSADHSFIIKGMPRIPMLVLLRAADDEFGADCKILYDSSATSYLDIESLCYLGENLARILKK